MERNALDISETFRINRLMGILLTSADSVNISLDLSNHGMMMMTARQGRSADQRLIETTNEEMSHNTLFTNQCQKLILTYRLSFQFSSSHFFFFNSVLLASISACFLKIILFFLPSSFSVYFLKSSSFLRFFFLMFYTSSWASLFFLFFGFRSSHSSPQLHQAHFVILKSSSDAASVHSFSILSGSLG